MWVLAGVHTWLWCTWLWCTWLWCTFFWVLLCVVSMSLAWLSWGLKTFNYVAIIMLKFHLGYSSSTSWQISMPVTTSWQWYLLRLGSSQPWWCWTWGIVTAEIDFSGHNVNEKCFTSKYCVKVWKARLDQESHSQKESTTVEWSHCTWSR